MPYLLFVFSTLVPFERIYKREQDKNYNYCCMEYAYLISQESHMNKHWNNYLLARVQSLNGKIITFAQI